jgi:hypothetical protein
MTFKIIDNVLPQEQFKEIKNFILNPGFPWNLSTMVTDDKEDLPISASYYFTHEFWIGFNTEPQAQVFAPLLNIMKCRAMIRIKGNLYPSTDFIVHHDNHIDYDFPHKGAIFYLNTNNGLTILENEINVESIENRLLLFDPNKPHRSTTCTNNKCRVNINFNFFFRY